MKKGLKIVTIGGGSSYTPELVEGFIKRYEELPLTELWLVDVEAGEEKQSIVGEMAKRMFKAAGIDCEVHLTLDRKSALKDADFVTTQLRVGQLDARILDERIPLSHGMIGQETNGAGGIFKALRTVPVILDIVEDMKVLCPNAWLVNFANPAGMVTEAVLRYGKWDKVVGLCNIPVNAEVEEAEILGRKKEELFFQFAGINHLHWHTVVDNQGNDLTDELIAKMYGKDADGKSIVANIKDNNLIFEQVENLHMVPCPYHMYYYMTDEMLKDELEDFKNNGTRAEKVKAIEKELFELYKDPELDHKPQQLAERGGARYSDAACNIINSIYNDKRLIMTVSTKNNGTVTDLPADSAVEVTCMITGNGPVPFQFGGFAPAERGLLQLMKAMEELTIEAAVTGDYGTLLQAFTTNPLITSGNEGKQVMDELLEAHKQYLPQFN
ncbi:6-phospho-beta-glucosidase [Carnobacterium maltaromaticum]|uniref:6-phospho-beta-glucosidase n=1 Tax=Carnobacterium maltaromaticum TaxID=2751 RepID=UPI0007051765|nr:6-phospho-beta-glucosidase [Carnobacterium maltaromaticum]KRN85469.1 6-phospho-beta-glucosidase [Carnobacterium maltaromaticum]MDT1944469.1 6-phospho-beta-glucosidase [Carnobacterium maltaromaticum]MDT1997809.1 6-phospho-beta-glucosidase [Carnobacterium maltaromaticum]TFJ27151.1 6-phospho-beta-glucosidase [Carnobacterium maltaromaticum]TFJ31223.1 6-phospho-beta-glucosidase [Carnobacterium maltaromaticum]